MQKVVIQQPRPQLVYGIVVYWISIVAALICTLAPIYVIVRPGNNILDPHFLFSTVWAGDNTENIWQQVGGGFPGGHFWIHNLSSGDAIIQLGIELGCCCAGIGLFAASIGFLREKPLPYGWVAASLTITLFVILAAVGIYQQAV